MQQKILSYLVGLKDDVLSKLTLSLAGRLYLISKRENSGISIFNELNS